AARARALWRGGLLRQARQRERRLLAAGQVGHFDALVLDRVDSESLEHISRLDGEDSVAARQVDLGWIAAFLGPACVLEGERRRDRLWRNRCSLHLRRRRRRRRAPGERIARHLARQRGPASVCQQVREAVLWRSDDRRRALGRRRRSRRRGVALLRSAKVNRGRYGANADDCPPYERLGAGDPHAESIVVWRPALSFRKLAYVSRRPSSSATRGRQPSALSFEVSRSFCGVPSGFERS